MLLDVDMPDDILDMTRLSSACSHGGRSADANDSKDEEPDDVVWKLWCFSPTMTLLPWLPWLPFSS